MSLRVTTRIAGAAGVALLAVLLMRSDLSGMLQTLQQSGWRTLWIVPYRLLFYLLFALGWRVLLRDAAPGRTPGVGFLLWAASAREAIDRLLPVASVGGTLAGVRMLRSRGVDIGAAGATVLAEILLNLFAICTFTAVGLLLLRNYGDAQAAVGRVLWALLFSIPVPVILIVALRRGSVFARLEGYLRPMIGIASMSQDAEAVDRQLRSTLTHGKPLFIAGLLQFLAILSGSAEIWFVMHLAGRPCTVQSAVMLESMTQALRHLAFAVPGAIGVQEAALLMFGALVGLDSGAALAISLAKRSREVLCALGSLLAWPIILAVQKPSSARSLADS